MTENLQFLTTLFFHPPPLVDVSLSLPLVTLLLILLILDASLSVMFESSIADWFIGWVFFDDLIDGRRSDAFSGAVYGYGL